MKRIFFLPLLLLAVMASAEQLMVPAMIVHGTNGVKQVVKLNDTNVTDLVVSQNGQSLSVDIPETQINGVRTLVFAVVAESDISSALENTENSLVKGVEKVLRDGQVFIHLLLPDGTILEYDMRGNRVN